MKRSIFIVLLIVVLALSACSSSASAEAGDSNSEIDTSAVVEEQAVEEVVVEEAAASDDSDGLTTDYENAASVSQQLIVGTFELEDTDQVVTADQTADLITLWTELQTLVEENMPQRGEPGEGMTPPEEGTEPQEPTEPDEAMTALQEEIDAILDKIQAAMTGEQISAIASLELTQEDVMTFMEENELMNGPADGEGGGPGGGGTPPEGGEGGPGGGGPGGGGPGGGGPVGGGEPPADGEGGGPGNGGRNGMGGNMVSTQLIDLVIELLENK